MSKSFYFITLLFFMLFSCQGGIDKKDTLFSDMPPGLTGIKFSNDLEYSEEFNPYIFKNFYNGGGVGLGDFNNDGLLDIYFCGNQKENKLYLNKGDFIFEDITSSAGVACKDVWSSGVSIVDINGDGLLDIYVCKSGSPEDSGIRHNELFINQGDLTFIEESQQYGLDFLGLSTHAAFFDYDKDGDLDCYLLNNSIRSVGAYDLIKDQREIEDSLGGNLLLENTSDQSPLTNSEVDVIFKDVTQEAGIYSSSIGFGLGVSIGDFNDDNWPDIYVSNDFFERDYLYINNRNGEFVESLESSIIETSMGSMGADIADINNDGHPEIFVTEMLPNTLERTKTKVVFENWDKYQRAVKSGYSRQFARNVLQLNMGTDSEHVPYFSEISRLTDTHATDWSWGALIFDYDNDGNKDIFVANGIGKDLLDQDYVNYYFNPENVRKLIKEKGKVMVELFDAIPSSPLPNYLFHNDGNLGFSNVASDMGLGKATFSNGSAYGDLDNDGDLDLVVNNINMLSSVYRNNIDTSNNYIKVVLEGNQQNKYAIGSKVYIYAGNDMFYQEVFPMRGFESSVDYRPNFGIGKSAFIDSIIVIWPDSRVHKITGPIESNKTVNVKYKDNLQLRVLEQRGNKTIFTKADDLLNYRHEESQYVDFDREKLSYYMRSNHGPASITGDINNDGLTDIIIGGAKGFLTQAFIQQKNGRLAPKNIPAFERYKDGEVTSLLLQDMDSDGDLDLIMGHGSNEVPASSSSLKDRLFLNDGKGNFTFEENYNAPYASTSTLAYIENNNDRWVFSGSGEVPFVYGIKPTSYLTLWQDQNLKPSLQVPLDTLGLIQDAVAGDIDGDGNEEFIVAAHYMPLTKINIVDRKPVITPLSGTETLYGWWNKILLEDLDGDGDLDLLALNHGLNSKFKLKEQEELRLITSDFDQNRSIEQILCIYTGKKSYPYATRDAFLGQLPTLKKKFIKYSDYAVASMEEIFSPEALKLAKTLKVNHLETTLFENVGGKFIKRTLPLQVQFTIQYDAVAMDVNNDGLQDLIIGGNQYKAKPEVGINAASYGTVLLNKGGMKFEYVTPNKSGIIEKGEIRYFNRININGKEHLVVLKNSDKGSTYLFNN